MKTCTEYISMGLFDDMMGLRAPCLASLPGTTQSV
jgi:hypothetical protein